MGQAAVRQAIVDFFNQSIANATLPYTGTVLSTRTYLDEQYYEQNSTATYTGSQSGGGCVIVVNLIGPDRRNLIALSGRGITYDFNIHTVNLELHYANISGDPVVAQEEYDQVVDAVVELVRQNPTLSAPSTVWSAGEYRAGVVHYATPPYTGADGATVYITGRITFEAWEQIT